MVIRVIIGIYLLIHGICHLVGFVVPWKIIDMKDEPYKTTLLADSIDVGDAGIRIIGIIWLLTAVCFIITAIGSFAALNWWRSLALYLSIFSLILCVVGLPSAKIGILANAIVLIYLFMSAKKWIPYI